jgi:protein-export membrane protein SecD
VVKRSKIIIFFVVLLMFALLMGLTTEKIVKGTKLGLDLQGGFEVLYEVKPIKKGQKITDETLKSTVEALNSRINVLGVSEPDIQIEGNNRIRVQLAGVSDQNKARELLSTQAELTFRDVNDKVLLDGSDLKENAAKQSFAQQTNEPIVTLELKDADKFAKVTEEVLQKKPTGENVLVIWLDYEKGDSYKEERQKELAGKDPKYISAPAVNTVLTQSDVMISGNFEVEEAQSLAKILNAGALPVKLDEVYSTSVGAKFGEKALSETVTAGFIGIAAIFLFMLFFYRVPGIIAVITLTIYIWLILAIFYLMHGVLTLPGIAALILGVGMAVDANIITYERIREELRSGKSVLSAFKAGNRRSFTTIFDANITTILAAAVLFAYGTSSVKGFALVLIISVLASFITAVFGTRLFLGLWVQSRLLDKKPGLFGVKERDIREL